MFAAIKIWGAAFGLLLGTLGFNCAAQAGHPWGVGHGHFHHGHHHGVGYGSYGYGYGSRAIYTSNLWGGGYAWSGYRGLGYSSISYSGWGYPSWYVRPAGYTSFYANISRPMTIYPRLAYYEPIAAYYAPTVYGYAPSYYDYAPSYCLPTAVEYEPAVVVPSEYGPAYCDACDAVSENAVENAVESTVESTVENTVQSELLLSSTNSHGIPDQLLASADAIFQAGGYQLAATAYAQLHVRYGSSDLIFGRRFIAQVACGDYDQAAVVLVSAQGAGFPIDRSLASTSDWSQLLAPQAEAVEGWTESLAHHALQAQGQHGAQQADQHEALELMATWLNLTGRPERAGLFLAMAERLSTEENLPLSSDSAARSSIASTEEVPAPSRAAAKLVLRKD